MTNPGRNILDALNNFFSTVAIITGLSVMVFTVYYVIQSMPILCLRLRRRFLNAGQTDEMMDILKAGNDADVKRNHIRNSIFMVAKRTRGPERKKRQYDDHISIASTVKYDESHTISSTEGVSLEVVNAGTGSRRTSSKEDSVASDSRSLADMESELLSSIPTAGHRVSIERVRLSRFEDINDSVNIDNRASVISLDRPGPMWGPDGSRCSSRSGQPPELLSDFSSTPIPNNTKGNSEVEPITSANTLTTPRTEAGRASQFLSRLTGVMGAGKRPKSPTGGSHNTSEQASDHRDRGSRYSEASSRLPKRSDDDPANNTVTPPSMGSKTPAETGRPRPPSSPPLPGAVADKIRHTLPASAFTGPQGDRHSGTSTTQRNETAGNESGILSSQPHARATVGPGMLEVPGKRKLQKHTAVFKEDLPLGFRLNTKRSIHDFSSKVLYVSKVMPSSQAERLGVRTGFMLSRANEQEPKDLFRNAELLKKMLSERPLSLVFDYYI